MTATPHEPSRQDPGSEDSAPTRGNSTKSGLPWIVYSAIAAGIGAALIGAGYAMPARLWEHAPPYWGQVVLGGGAVVFIAALLFNPERRFFRYASSALAFWAAPHLGGAALRLSIQPAELQPGFGRVIVEAAIEGPPVLFDVALCVVVVVSLLLDFRLARGDAGPSPLPSPQAAEQRHQLVVAIVAFVAVGSVLPAMALLRPPPSDRGGEASTGAAEDETPPQAAANNPPREEARGIAAGPDPEPVVPTIPAPQCPDAGPQIDEPCVERDRGRWIVRQEYRDQLLDELGAVRSRQVMKRLNTALRELESNTPR